MEKEAKKGLLENESGVAESTQGTVDVNETEETDVDLSNNLIITRKAIPNVSTVDGRKMYNFFVIGKLRGCEVKVNFEPFDTDGYRLLDIVYGDSDTATLKVKETKRKMIGTNQRIVSTEYEAVNIEDDFIYKCRIKCKAKSDEDLLAMLIARLKVAK